MSSIVSIRQLQSAVLWAALWATVPAQAAWNLLDGAKAQPPLAPGVPKGSDVVFSVRSTKPEAVDVAKSFGATRVEWVYTSDEDLVARFHKEIGWFGGSQNSITKTPTPAGKAKDFDGNPIVNPRMKSWNVQWDTTTHPETEKALRASAKKYLEMGADSLQVDDPLLQLYSAQLWGGDFNESTLAGFPAYLKDRADKAKVAQAGLEGFTGSYRELLRTRFKIRDAKDYQQRAASLPTHPLWLDYLRQTVADHYAGLRDYMKSVRGKPVPLSMNLTFLDRPSEDNRHFFLTAYADYAISETPIDDLLEMQMRAATARALGMGFVPSIKTPDKPAANRFAIATFYALGANPLVPWDVYTGNNAAGEPMRYYGKPAEYGDLYGFVREHHALFDDLEQTAVVGIAVPVDHFAERPTMELVRKLNQRRIPFAFVPVGGKQRDLPVDIKRIGHFKLLTTPNPQGDFTRDDWRALEDAKVAFKPASALRDAELENLTPFIVVGGAERLQLYPRAGTGKEANRLVVHFVDEARAASGKPDADCKRRVSMRLDLFRGLRVDRVGWHTPNRDTLLTFSKSGDDQILFTVPDCPLWGALRIDLTDAGEISSTPERSKPRLTPQSIQ